MSYTIYLLEDEENLNDVLVAYLSKEGWSIKSFKNAEETKENIKIKPDLWILDIMLPDGSGYDLIKEIKQIHPDVPVIFISARDQSFDRILGLELGSEDYLPKPFLPKELVVRSKKVLERIYGNTNNNVNLNTYKVLNYLIVEEHRFVKKENKDIELTSLEFDLILTFVKNNHRIFSRDELLNLVWGINYFGSDRVVDDLIRRIRKKINDFPIETVYGYGYRISY